MLGFIVTDVAIEPDLLRRSVKNAVDRTFNMITVDGDTSTNDMVAVMANGLAEKRAPCVRSPTRGMRCFMRGFWR